MIIYGNGGRPFDRCDDFGPLRSSIGVGPQGDGIDVRVVENDPYGYYRLQFLNSNTGEVLTTTPNLDPGSRFFVCTQDFWLVGPRTSFEAAAVNFSTMQAITVQDARVGDLVIYHVSRPIPDDDNRHHSFLGFGVITNISSNDGGRITFTEIFEFDTMINIEELRLEPVSNLEIDDILYG